MVSEEPSVQSASWAWEGHKKKKKLLEKKILRNGNYENDQMWNGNCMAMV